MTGQKGARMQQLKLRTAAQYARAKVSDILSEGEQRVIAMALFLAEVGIEPGRSGLIFDDPVSSLDHVRREKIAKRLVLEAKQRQIIVFTHDLAFAWALKDFAEENGVAAVDRHVFSAGSKKGICGEGLPFEGKRLGARVNELRDQAKRAQKTLEEERNHDLYNDIVRNGYRRMRVTWDCSSRSTFLPAPSSASGAPSKHRSFATCPSMTPRLVPFTTG
jgi:ABC-type nitrate/sulfonate/bicarbonate transport system ATPase subunit